MKLNKIEWRNFASYGNKIQTLEFENDKSNLYLVVGENGSGKCLHPETKIKIKWDDPLLSMKLDKFLNGMK